MVHDNFFARNEFCRPKCGTGCLVNPACRNRNAMCLRDESGYGQGAGTLNNDWIFFAICQCLRPWFGPGLKINEPGLADPHWKLNRGNLP